MKAYVICHDVPVMVGGITVRCRFFVLENLSQDIILGRPWERMVRAKHDNRDDGSCFTTIYDERENAEMFCSVPAHYERNRAGAKTHLQQSDNWQQNWHRNYYASSGGKVMYEGYSVEEIHVDDEGDAFRVKYKMLGRMNRITVIDDDKQDGTYAIGNNDEFSNNKVMQGRALSKQQEEKWAARATQRYGNAEDIATAQQNIRKNRLKNKAYFDKNCHRRVDKIGVGDMVLLYNSSLDKRSSQKLQNRWLGPYRIWEIAEHTDTYLPDELASIQLDSKIAGDHIKKFHPRYGVDTAEDAADAKDDRDAESDADNIGAEDDGEDDN